MDLDSVSEESRPVLVVKEATGSAVMPRFDPVLLELGEAGEDGARLVFSKYQRRVRRFFEKKGISSDEAQDLTQETFLRVFRNEARLDNRPQLEAWLFEIARNVLANAVRARVAIKRMAAVTSLDEPHLEGNPKEVADSALLARETDALTSAITREQLEILHHALAELPDQMRQCVRFRVKDDLRYREIAEVMKISVETVKSHLHFAKKRLRPLLEPHFGPIDF
jgi:RNA polymerase sigma-70 factor (ECF subfamily)